MNAQAAWIIAIGIAAAGALNGGLYAAYPQGDSAIYVVNRLTGKIKACAPASDSLRCRLQEKARQMITAPAPGRAWPQRFPSS